MATQKGSTFEREICRKLSLWFTDGGRDDVFWRSSQSGGRAKTRSKFGKKTFGSYGDITAVDPIGLPLTQLCILECKNGYKKWSPLDGLDVKPVGRQVEPSQQTFESFLEQMNEDKKISGIPYSILIFHRDKRETCVAVETKLSLKMRTWCGPVNFPFLRYCYKEDYTITTLPYFLDWANPQFFKEFYDGISKRS